MRLIDADDTLDTIEKYCGDYFNHDDQSFDKNAVRITIKMAETIDPVRSANACYCKECSYYEPLRDYSDCSKKLPYGYCYYWKYEEGESPNEVYENDFCSKGVIKNVKTY